MKKKGKQKLKDMVAIVLVVGRGLEGQSLWLMPRRGPVW